MEVVVVDDDRIVVVVHTCKVEREGHTWDDVDMEPLLQHTVEVLALECSTSLSVAVVVVAVGVVAVVEVVVVADWVQEPHLGLETYCHWWG